MCVVKSFADFLSKYPNFHIIMPRTLAYVNHLGILCNYSLSCKHWQGLLYIRYYYKNKYVLYKCSKITDGRLLKEIPNESSRNSEGLSLWLWSLDFGQLWPRNILTVLSEFWQKFSVYMTSNKCCWSIFYLWADILKNVINNNFNYFYVLLDMHLTKKTICCNLSVLRQ